MAPQQTYVLTYESLTQLFIFIVHLACVFKFPCFVYMVCMGIFFSIDEFWMDKSFHPSRLADCHHESCTHQTWRYNDCEMKTLGHNEWM